MDVIQRGEVRLRVRSAGSGEAAVLLPGMGRPATEIAEAIRLAQAENTDPATRARAVREAWYGPGRDISVWMSGWSQAVMKASQEAAAATDTASWWTAGEAPVVIVQGLA